MPAFFFNKMGNFRTKNLQWVGLIFAVLVLAAIGLYREKGKQENKAFVLYTTHCASCHGAEGEGLKKLIPPLQNADYVLQNAERLACIIRYGIHEPIEVNGVPYQANMLGNSRLENDEIRDLVNLIYVDWNGGDKAYNLKEIRQQLDQCLIPMDTDSVMP